MSLTHSHRPPSPRFSPSGVPLGGHGRGADHNLGLGQLVAAASIAQESPHTLRHGSPHPPHHSSTSAQAAGGHFAGQGPAESSSSVVAALKARQPKTGAKRGRKRIEDAQDGKDATDARTSAKHEPDSTLDANEKRKLQNRAAQRAFRERKEQHVKDMEVATVQQAAQLEHYYDIIQKLLAEVEALRRGEFVQPTVTELPPPPITAPAFNPDNATSTPTPPPPHTIRAHSPLDVKPAIPSPLGVPAAEPQPVLSPSLDGAKTQLNAIPAFDLAPSVPVPSPSSLDAAPYSGLTELAATLPVPPPLPPAPLLADVDMPPYDHSFDDFDAPFDLTSAVPLPPLFNDLFSQSFAPLPLSTPSGGASFDLAAAPDDRTAAAKQADAEADEFGEDLCPIDDSEPPPLVNGRMPCDKPECDFTSYSCALPMPWRPPSLEEDVRSRDVWVAQVAWAKLVSHPQFKYCDVDELCTELRDRARCSEDGRVVISKMEACDVFRSIPRRARAARERDGL